MNNTTATAAATTIIHLKKEVDFFKQRLNDVAMENTCPIIKELKEKVHDLEVDRDNICEVCDSDNIEECIGHITELNDDMSCMVDKERLSFRLGHGSLTEEFDWEKAVLGMRKDLENCEEVNEILKEENEKLKKENECLKIDTFAGAEDGQQEEDY
jgi:hypothetical protein